MNTNDHALPLRARTPFLLGLVAAAALTLGACNASVIATVPPSISGTVPPVIASQLPACVDAPTLAIIDQIGAAGADVPALLSANKDALIAGLGNLQSSDPVTTTWRDDLVAALQSGNVDLAALQVAKLTNDEVNLTAC